MRSQTHPTEAPNTPRTTPLLLLLFLLVCGAATPLSANPTPQPGKPKVWVVPLGSHPESIALNPTDNTMYVAAADSVLTIKLAQNNTQTLGQGWVVGVTPDPGGPAAATYDPQNHQLYVADKWSGTITVIDTATLRVAATIALGPPANTTQPSYPAATVYDPQNRLVYVFEEGSAIVAALNTTTHRVEANITLMSPTLQQSPYTPASMVYDPQNGHIYLTYNANRSIVDIDPATQTYKTVGLNPYSPAGITLDPRNRQLYVSATCPHILVAYPNTHHQTGRLEQPGLTCPTQGLGGPYMGAIIAINTTTDKVTSYIPLGQTPRQIAYDPQDNLLYVVDPLSNTIYTVDPDTGNTTQQYYAATLLESPPYSVGDLAYDPQDNLLYYAGYYTGTLYALNTTTLRPVGETPLAGTPQTMVYDPADNTVYVGETQPDAVAALAHDTVAWVAPTTFTPQAMLYDPYNNMVYVAGQNTLAALDPNTGSLVDHTRVAGAHTITLDTQDQTIYVGGNGGIWAIKPLGGEPLGTGPKQVYGGQTPLTLLYDPQTNLLYYTTQEGTLVAAKTTGSVVATLRVGGQPTLTLIDPQNQNIYIADPTTRTLTAINTQTLQVEANITLTQTPRAITLDQQNRLIYVAYEPTQPETQLEIAQINTTTNTPTANITIQAPYTQPTAILYNPTQNQVYLAATPLLQSTNVLYDIVTPNPPADIYVIQPQPQTHPKPNYAAAAIALTAIATITTTTILLAKNRATRTPKPGTPKPP